MAIAAELPAIVTIHFHRFPLGAASGKVWDGSTGFCFAVCMGGIAVEWRSLSNHWVLQPDCPKAVIHFLGGAFIGNAPQVGYDALLSALASDGYLVVATQFETNPNHWQITRDIFNSLPDVLSQLQATVLPRFGIGHSLGGKLHVLGSCYEASAAAYPLSPRDGNILMAYCNASLRLDPLPSWLPVEFNPSPVETERAIASHYDISRTLLVKFVGDEIDTISALHDQLVAKFRRAIDYRCLPGDHGTCAGGRYPFSANNEFSPLDAIGQFVYQRASGDRERLFGVLRPWLKRQLAVLALEIESV